MSEYPSCVFPCESPPSLDTPNKSIGTPSEYFPTIPITPSSPDGDNFESQSVYKVSELPMDEDATYNSAEINADISIEDNEQLGDNDSCRTERTNLTEYKSNSEYLNLSSHTQNNEQNTNTQMLSNKLDILDSSKNVHLNSTQNNDNIFNSNSDNNICNEQHDISLNSSKSLDNNLSNTKFVSKNIRLESSPKLISTLTLTDDHPLMLLSSPDSPPSTSNYPDLIIQSYKSNKNTNQNVHKANINENNNLLGSDCSGMMSLSSTEDESLNKSLANGEMNSLHSESFSNRSEPQRNTSKNNLYFYENFTTCDGSKSVEGCCITDDKIKTSESFNFPNAYRNDPKTDISTQPDILDSRCLINHNKSSDSAIRSNVHPDLTFERKKIKPDVSAPKLQMSNDSKNNSYYNIPDVEDQLSTGYQDIPSPDSSTASKPENDRSLYLAEIDPFGGSASLKPREPKIIKGPIKKRIKPLPNETDTESTTALSNPTLFASCRNELSGSASSLESLSDCSLYSDGVFPDKSMPADGFIHSNVIKNLDKLAVTNTGDGSDTETASSVTEKIPEYSLTEERNDERRWLKITLPTGEQRTIDMKVIEPYKRVLSHGGYALSGRRDAIVVFSACHLPDSSRVDYNYVMDNLFLYVITTLEQLVTDDYILIYLHGSASKRSMPTFHWLKKCYQLIDRRLRKSLKHLYLVHPTFWLKSIMWMTRPFISSKFSRKLSYVYSLDELENLVPVEQAAIPEKVRRYDSTRT